MTINNHESYIQYCLNLAKENLSSYKSIKEVAYDEDNINIYKNIKFLQEPKNIAILDDNSLTKNNYKEALRCVLEGGLFTEHAAAGEATRLGIGTKYMINMAKDLSIEKIAELISKEKGTSFSKAQVIEQSGCLPEALLPLTLGNRHIMQFSYDISKLAKNSGYNHREILFKQRILLIVNEATADKITEEFIANNFFGFDRNKVFFMIQKAYHGLNYINGDFFYDENSPKRLYNHGQMVMQQTMDDQIFHIDEHENKNLLKSDEFAENIKKMEDKISYNIEDLEYLIGSIDYKTLAFALKKGNEGYRMLMEIVDNDPINPQKGGMAAFDNVLGRNVMIEGFQLKGIKNHEIKYLNKNFNHYIKPYETFLALKKSGLNMPVSVKNGFIYFQPVQGDINFLLKTEFFQRKILKPIKAWKSPATTPLAIHYMHLQDKQDGFKEYSETLFRVKR